MTQMQPLNEAALARETLNRLCGEKSVLHRVVKVLKLVGHSSVGLGEVLQDYAHQTGAELQGIIRAGLNVSRGAGGSDDAEALHTIHFVLKAVKSVLEMTPAAMQRNKAEALGEKEKLTRADVAAITHAFLHSSDIARLLAAEDSGQIFAGLAPAEGDDAGRPPPERERALATASH